MRKLKKILELLSPNELKHAVLLALMILIMALLIQLEFNNAFNDNTVKSDLIETNSILNSMFHFLIF